VKRRNGYNKEGEGDRKRMRKRGEKRKHFLSLVIFIDLFFTLWNLK